jgi:hypothetical protein
MSFTWLCISPHGDVVYLLSGRATANKKDAGGVTARRPLCLDDDRAGRAITRQC